MVRPMDTADFLWAATLMERRRQRYASFSPVFWRPADGVVDLHAAVLEASAAQPGSLAVRTDHGFALMVPAEQRFVVDDFAVEHDRWWPTEGRQLLDACREAIAETSPTPTLRVVSACRDAPKVSMLAEAGLVAVARWWVKELVASDRSPQHGPATVGEVDATMVPAPPVYDPGGPVCLLGDVTSARAIEAATDAARAGAVLAVVQRDRAPRPAPPSEPELERAGFHNPSAFYEDDR